MSDIPESNSLSPSIKVEIELIHVTALFRLATAALAHFALSDSATAEQRKIMYDAVYAAGSFLNLTPSEIMVLVNLDQIGAPESEREAIVKQMMLK